MARDGGRVIRQARDISGLSKSEFAARVGTSRAAIDQIEKGERNPRLTTLQSIASAAGCRLDLRLIEPPPVPSDAGLAVAALNIDVDDPLWSWRWLIGDFVANVFVPASSAERIGLLAGPPAPTTSPDWDRFLHALAEHLCIHGRVDPPPWLTSGIAEPGPFWWPVHGALPSQRAAAMAHSPASFKRRQILVDGREMPDVLP